jgi:hypothetical protein
VRIRIVFGRVGGAGITAQPTIEQGEAPDTFLIFARDPLHPLPLRLCTFAPLRSFLPTGRIGVRNLPFVGGVQLPAVAGAQGLKHRRFDA